MVGKVLIKCAGASLASVMAIGLASPGALAWGGSNSISETGPGSVNVIYASSSNYSPRSSSTGYSSYGNMGGYSMMQHCNNSYGSWSEQSDWYRAMCSRKQQGISYVMYAQKQLYVANRYTQQPCDP
jgi:hypothetical protein